MKELSIEQKAKAYDEAIAYAKKLLKTIGNATIGNLVLKNEFERMFPELKESDGEKIRKALIRFHKSTIDIDGIKGEDIIAFLEKRGEQKPVDKVEPKFHEGNWIVEDVAASTWLVTKVFTTEENVTAYNMINQKGRTLVMGSHNIDYRYHFWTIKDAKDGDVLVNWNNNIYLFKGIEEEVVKFHCYYSTNYEEFNIPFNNNSHLGLTEPQFEHHPATKEQRDTLFAKMKEAGYEWDAEKKELKKIDNEEFYGEDYGIDSLYHAQLILEETLGKVDGYQSDDGILEHKCAISAVKQLAKQKPAEWSEEDEEKLKAIISLMKSNRAVDPFYDKMYLEKWLKSLKERHTWKPSDEQITWLYRAADISDKGSRMKQVLNVLLEQLKKLKEE